MRLLSTLVGERLLHKQGRGVALTEAGNRLARKLQPAFSDIARSVGEAIGGARNVVRLAICSSFGPGWLI
ncbi:MAG: LysR family transcriptional regulator, partial [Shinella sp.]